MHVSQLVSQPEQVAQKFEFELHDWQTTSFGGRKDPEIQEFAQVFKVVKTFPLAQLRHSFELLPLQFWQVS